MLRLLDEALEAMLRVRVPLSDDEVGVAFDAPNSDWSAGLIRPTVNLFLRAVTPSEGQAAAGMAVYEENGKMVRRSPHPRFECSYLVTAWTTDIRDEHQLLGAVLAAVLREPTMDAAFVAPALAHAGPPVTLAVVRDATGRSGEFWSALGGKLKLGLDLVATASVDAAAVSAVGPPTAAYEVRVEDASRGSSRAVVGGVAPGVAAGTVVRTPRGASSTDAAGRFVVTGRPGDVVVVEAEPPRRATVPDQGEVIVESE